MQLIIDTVGNVKCIYDEAIDLAALGQLHITRASHVEPDERGHWWADMSPVGGPRLGPFTKRGAALQMERAWAISRLQIDGNLTGSSSFMAAEYRTDQQMR